MPSASQPPSVPQRQPKESPFEARAELSPEDEALLEFESRRWRSPVLKQRQMEAELEMAPRAYFRRLGQLLGSCAAWERFPETMDRAQRRLEQSQAHYSLWEAAFPRAQAAEDEDRRGGQ